MYTQKDIEMNISSSPLPPQLNMELHEVEAIVFDESFFGPAQVPTLFKNCFGPRPFSMDCHSLEHGKGFFRISGQGELNGRMEQVQIYFFQLEGESRHVIDLGRQPVTDFSELEWCMFPHRKDSQGGELIVDLIFRSSRSGFPSVA